MNTFKVNVISNTPVCSDTYKMVLTCPNAFISEFVAGQFIHIKIPNANELILRRPISIHRVDETGITIIYKVVGTGTQHLANLKTDSTLDILGPIGNGFPTHSQYKKIALVGGGLGCAPLLSVPSFDNSREYHSFLGFASCDMMYMTRDMELLCESCHVSTDDGSFGVEGNAVSMLSEFLKSDTVDAIFACGPLPMLKALSKIKTSGDIFVSLEERMGCGYGSCLTCVCKTPKNGYKRVCVDGPVFPIEEVEFNG